MPKRILQGQVVSDKMSQTVVVAVKKARIHPKYKRRFEFVRKFYAHDPQNKYKIGDTVRIIETRPLSRLKRWEVLY
jgi:small subunit ribosomal protein S17